MLIFITYSEKVFYIRSISLNNIQSKIQNKKLPNGIFSYMVDTQCTPVHTPIPYSHFVCLSFNRSKYS